MVDLGRIIMPYYLETPEGYFLKKVVARERELKKQFDCDILGSIVIVYSIKKRKRG